jgi:surfeit locus 1 family protein
VTLLALAMLIGLGVWQLERKAWKDGLIATLSSRTSAPPGVLPPPMDWDKLDRNSYEFLRVKLSVEFLHEHEVVVFTSGSSLRPDVSGAGYWVFTPARLAGGRVVMVDRGFVPEALKNKDARPEGQVAGVVEIVGALRWPEQRSFFTPADTPARNQWFTRDPQAVAEAKGIGPAAPFYIAQEAPQAPGRAPRVGKLQPSLPNNHLQYALTWFALALALAAVFLAWAIRRRRPSEPM